MWARRASVVLATMMTVWLAVAPAQGQTVAAAYVVGGVGQSRSAHAAVATIHVAAGAEARLARGRFGLGAEIGYLAATRDLLGGGGVLSPNATLYVPTGAHLVAFASAGYTLLFRWPSSDHAFNAAGGVEYRLGSRVGLRVEARDHLPRGWRHHLWTARAGLTFW
jgi:hypothetical protein